MSLNKPATALWAACLACPGGAETIYLDGVEAAKYNADPDGYAAKHFGLSLVEYLEWVRLDGEPYCAAITKGGFPCRNLCGPAQSRALEWKALHRKDYCGVHSA